MGRGGGWLTSQNVIETIEDKIAFVIALFPFIISSLNDPKEGVHPLPKVFGKGNVDQVRFHFRVSCFVRKV